MHISIKDLRFKYDRNQKNIIDNMSIDIEQGSITVLLGLNGCGKTTLIKLLAGLLETKDGFIKYDGKKINEISIKERSKIFSYVPQQSISVEDCIIRDYLTYGFVNSLKFYQFPNHKQLEKVDEISKELGIENLLDKRLGKISGGERQIITIASCILQDTPVILLDEPTSSLDLKNQNIVLSLLKKIAKKDKTIILSSHNPNHALFLDSEVALMNDGHILQIGKCNKMINTTVLKDIYGNAICYSEELLYKEVSFRD